MYDVFEKQRQEATKLESGLLVLSKAIPAKERIHLMIWQPKAKKPYFNYSVKPELADKWVKEADERLVAHKQMIEARKEKRKPTEEKLKTIKLGDIYYTSWGWEQTNIDFYQVIEMKGASISLRKISTRMIEQDSWGSGKVMPVKDKFIEEKFTKRASFELGMPTFNISSFKTAYPWDGKYKGCSWWG